MSLKSKARTKIDDIKENYRERRIASKVRDAAGTAKDVIKDAGDSVKRVGRRTRRKSR